MRTKRGVTHLTGLVDAEFLGRFKLVLSLLQVGYLFSLLIVSSTNTHMHTHNSVTVTPTVHSESIDLQKESVGLVCQLVLETMKNAAYMKTIFMQLFSNSLRYTRHKC